MKLFNVLVLLALLGAFTACDYDSFEEEEALMELEAANPFVRLSNADVGGVRTVTVSDSGQVFTVELVNPSNVESDLVVDYSLGGSATYGTVYTADNGGAAGGSIDIAFDDGSGTDATVSEVITFTTLVDTLVNGPQTIEFELTGVTASSGATFDVGQGPLYRTLTINLVND